MDRKRLAIGIGILILIGVGLWFVSNMTGGVISGSVVMPMKVQNENFKVSELNNEVVKNGEGNDRSG